MKKSPILLLALSLILGCNMNSYNPPNSNSGTDSDSDNSNNSVNISTSSLYGKIQILPEKVTYDKGDSITVKAIPDSNYKFKKWIINGTKYLENPILLTLQSDLICSARYSLIPSYELEVKYNKYRGGVTSPISEVAGLYYGGTYKENTEIELLATALSDVGFTFSHWEVGDSIFYDNPITITLLSNKIVKPFFVDTKEIMDPNNFITSSISTGSPYWLGSYHFEDYFYRITNTSDLAIEVIECKIFREWGTGYAYTLVPVNSILSSGCFFEGEKRLDYDEVDHYLDGYVEWKCLFDDIVFFVRSR